MADTLNIKPMIDIIDGDMVPGENLRGRNCIDKFLEKVMVNPERIDPKRIFVTHCLADEAGEVKERLMREYGFKNVIISEASPGVSMNCGPGALGIMYMSK
jgi:fatty acid-binding protein DegV